MIVFWCSAVLVLVARVLGKLPVKNFIIIIAIIISLIINLQISVALLKNELLQQYFLGFFDHKSCNNFFTST